MTFKRAALAAVAILNLVPAYVIAQGRGIPNTTPEQTAALTQMSAYVALPARSLVEARTDLIATALAQPRNESAIQAKVDAVRAAELALANARADAFAKLQASPDKLTAAQIAAVAASFGTAGRGGGGGGAARTACRTSLRSRPSRSQR